VDGVRQNDPFGDTANWDSIPTFAIKGMQLSPGSNPVFGMNTLGGAITMQTKSGRTDAGSSIQVSGGSWGRISALFQHGGVSQSGKYDYYIGNNTMYEEGWRKYSPTRTNQFFGKLGYQDERTRMTWALTDTKTLMAGLGFTPANILASEGEDAIFTRPDETKNNMTQFNFSGEHWVNDKTMISGNLFSKASLRTNINGDVSGEYNPNAYYLGTDYFSYNATGSSTGGPAWFLNRPFDAYGNAITGGTYVSTNALIQSGTTNRFVTSATPGTSATATDNTLGGTSYASSTPGAANVGKQCLYDPDGEALDNLGYDADEAGCRAAAYNQSKTHSQTLGGNLQASLNRDLFGKKNDLIVGTALTASVIDFTQTQILKGWGDAKLVQGAAWAAYFDPSRMVIPGTTTPTPKVKLHGRTYNASIYGIDYLSLNDEWHLNGGARYDYQRVENIDRLNAKGSSASLAGTHNFGRLNPTVGLAYTPSKIVNVFGSYSESNRAPTPIELGCADPNNDCLMPNAMAADPHLNDVVTKTFQGGLRGQLAGNIVWDVNAYSAVNHDDIQFMSSRSTSYNGYFKNIGRTKREGFDAGLSGSYDKLRWNMSYSYVEATYDTDLTLSNNGANSSASCVDTPSSPMAGACTISVKKGNYLAGIPKDQLKFRFDYEVFGNLNIGANILSFSKQYVQGNENQKHNNVGYSGSTPGYTIVNLDANLDINKNWKLFANATNIFDKDFYNGGRFVVNNFNGSLWEIDNPTKTLGVIPGAPRAGWIGVRYEFGGSDKKN
jgi:outer membrane receptor protein involved in Fe transport